MKRLATATPQDSIKATGLALKSIKSELSNLSFIDATIGVFHDNREDGMPSWYREALAREQKVSRKTGYNFVGMPEYLEGTARLIFGNEVDTSTLAMAPSYGGSHAIYLGNSVLQDIVPVGLPTWPNHPGLIENAGGLMVAYRHLDDSGNFNFEGFRQSIEELSLDNTELLQHAHKRFMMRWGIDPKSAEQIPSLKNVLETKNISPLIHAICHNPLGVNIPKDQWAAIVTLLKKNDTTLQIDLAYMGFGESVEKDVELVRYLFCEGVKLFLYFSYSKFHAHYAERRAGAVLCANFSKPERAVIQEKLLQQIRNTTSAIGTEPQSLSLRIEKDEDIRIEQREWVRRLKEISKVNREILNSGVPDAYKLSTNTSGPFFFARDGATTLLPWIFPELAEKLGYEVSKEARAMPQEFMRIAAIPTSGEEGLGFGGVRIGLPLLTDEMAREAVKTFAYVYERIYSL